MIKKICFTKSLLLVSALISFYSYADHERVTDENIPFLYDVRAEIKATDEKLASIMSKDYRLAKDEFSRYDLLQKIKPIIDNRLQKAAKTDAIELHIGGNLEDYDFDKKGFPSGFGEGTYIPFQNKYAVTFSNSNDIQFIPVSMESARLLSSELQKNRRASYIIKGNIIEVKEDNMNYHTYKTIKMKITEIEAKLSDSGKLIGNKII
ncbi:DUF4852 domain-containing protein [Vibrio scophthalmi]|uniref:Uncharacterized protein n=1 Tax=Vibrio scophthalmi TaxID=45658 RepID=A0A1E3WIU8_9VIBR|nr:DUF4852 domain-containing protein [Vibrio scophthalmi]ODS09644.1 hypothetical protein VSF3289_03308 [Vibrio scophthalmi]